MLTDTPESYDPAEGSETFTLRDLFYALGLLVLCVTALKLASAQLIPIALALLVWFMINAVASGFGRIPLIGAQLSETLRLLLALFTIGYLIWSFGAVLVQNASDITNEIPAAERNIDKMIADLYTWLGRADPPSVKSMFDSVQTADIGGRLVSEFTSIAGIATTVALYVLFLLLDQTYFPGKLRYMINDPERLAFVQSSLNRIKSDTSAYLWLMTLASTLVGIATFLILTAAGVGSAGFWAMVCFLLNFIPTLGSFLGVILPTLYLFSQDMTLGTIAVVTMGLAAVQFFAGNIMLPRMFGERLNISPFVVILSLFSWNAMWGAVGMLMAVPIMAILMIVLAAFPSTRPLAILMSKNGRLSAPRMKPRNGHNRPHAAPRESDGG